jgi:prephenate dehydratase
MREILSVRKRPLPVYAIRSPTCPELGGGIHRPAAKSMTPRRDFGLRIVYQGEPGAFGEEACRVLLPEADPVGVPTFADTFERVARGDAEWAAVPAENSYAGSIPQVYDLIQRHELMIYADVLLPVEQVLMALPGVTLDRITRVVSHPQALAQCDQFLATRPWKVEPLLDTAGSARYVRDHGLTDVGVIAGRAAARLYGLEVLRDGIMSQPDNRTRFWLIAPPGRPPRPGIPVTTTLVLSLSNRPGALLAVLEPLARAGINLRRIESRPDTEPFSSRFIVELEGNFADPATRAAIGDLTAVTRWVRMVGSYPRVSAS